jgi:ABC-2 type transport system permease protein
MRKLVSEFEFRQQGRNIRFIAGAVMIYLLFAAALYSGYRQYITENKEIQIAREITYQQWTNQGEKNPHSAAHYGLYAFKSITPLFIFDKGIEDFLGRAVWLEAHNQNEVRISKVKDQGLNGRYGYLTVAFVWQLFIPLLIILLCFDSVSREKENGTIRMLFSTGISGSDLLWGKVWACMKLVLYYLVIPMFMICFSVILFNTEEQKSSIFLHGVFIFLLYCLYFLIWAIFTVYFSTRFSSSATLALLSGIWIFMGFLLPRISGTLAGIMVPTPTAFEFTQAVLEEREKGEDGTRSYEQFQEALKQKILTEYGVERTEDLPVSFAGYSLMESELKDWKVYDKHYGKLNSLFSKQNFIITLINSLSPVQTQRLVSSAFTYTDLHNHIHFATQAEQHRRLVQDILNEDQLKNGVGKERGYLASADLWQKIPDFEFQRKDFSKVLRRQWGNLFLLIVWITGGAIILNSSAGRIKYSV